MGELDDSLTFALGAGQHFDVSDNSEYVTTIICKSFFSFVCIVANTLCSTAKCIDKYIHLRTLENTEPVDSRLQDIVERMFQRCADDGEYEQAIGIALESRRLDIVESNIRKGDADKLLAYVLDVSMTLIQNLEFRNEVLRLLVNLYKTLEKPDYISISQCLVHLDDSESCAQLLKSLVEKDNEVHMSIKFSECKVLNMKYQLMAYQISFDLEENATQKFLSKVSNLLPSEPVAEETRDDNAMEVEEVRK